MSFEKDITQIKKILEASRIFKPATPEQIASRPDPRTEEIKTRSQGFRQAVDALSAAGITKVVIDFAGNGDSGSVDDIQYFKGKKAVNLPGTPEFAGVDDAMGDTTDYIDGDWYNNEGGQGTIVLNTRTRIMTINVGYNYTANGETEQTTEAIERGSSIDIEVTKLAKLGISKVDISFYGYDSTWELSNIIYYKGDRSIEEPKTPEFEQIAIVLTEEKNIGPFLGDYNSDEGGSANVIIDTKTKIAVVAITYDYTETDDQLQTIQL